MKALMIVLMLKVYELSLKIRVISASYLFGENRGGITFISLTLVMVSGSISYLGIVILENLSYILVNGSYLRLVS